MATLRKYGGKYNSTFCQLCGLSTDTKPTSVLINDRSVGLADGSEFIEMDTNKKYRYSADNSTWYEVENGGGGGGSATLIDKTITANGTYDAVNDGADGYKSVDVEVASTPNFNKIVASRYSQGYSKVCKTAILRSADGYYNLDSAFFSDNNLQIIFADPVKKIMGVPPLYSYLQLELCFTPHAEYEGVYNSNNTLRATSGATIVPGDGRAYSYALTYSPYSSTQSDTVYDTGTASESFTFTLE